MNWTERQGNAGRRRGTGALGMTAYDMQVGEVRRVDTEGQAVKLVITLNYAFGGGAGSRRKAANGYYVRRNK